MTFVLTGGKELEATLALATKQGPDVAAASLTQLAEQIMADAVELAPVDTGALRASGHVDPAEVSPQQVSVTMGFNAEYALVQHERTDYHHTVGQAKYLETPMKARAPELAGIFRVKLDEFAEQWKFGKSEAAIIDAAIATWRTPDPTPPPPSGSPFEGWAKRWKASQRKKRFGPRS